MRDAVRVGRVLALGRRPGHLLHVQHVLAQGIVLVCTPARGPYTYYAVCVCVRVCVFHAVSFMREYGRGRVGVKGRASNDVKGSVQVNPRPPYFPF